MRGRHRRGRIPGTRAACRRCWRGLRRAGLVRAVDARTPAARARVHGGRRSRAGRTTRLQDALRGAHAVVHLAAQAHRPPIRRRARGAARDQCRRRPRLARAAAARRCRALRLRELGEGARRDLARRTRPARGRSARPSRCLRREQGGGRAALADGGADTGLRITALRLPLVVRPRGQGQLRRADPRGARRHAAAGGRASTIAAASLAPAISPPRSWRCSRARTRDARRAFTPYLLADAKPVSTPELVRAIARALARRAAHLFACPPALLRFAGACVGEGERLSAPARLAGSGRHRVSHAVRMDAAAIPSRPGSPPRCATPRRYNRPLRESRDSMPSRSGGRSADDLRPLRFTRGFTKHAEGSVLVEMGETRVLCTASVEEGVPVVHEGPRRGLAHRRIRHAPARDPHPRTTRGGRRQAVRTHAGDPAPHRPQPARGHRPRSARRAHDQDRLRRAAGRWRHALRVHHGRRASRWPMPSRGAARGAS